MIVTLKRRIDRLNDEATAASRSYVCVMRPDESEAEALARHAVEHPGARAVVLAPPVMTEDEWLAMYGGQRQ